MAFLSFLHWRGALFAHEPAPDGHAAVPGNLFLELRSHEEIDDWIQAAVEAGKAQAEGLGVECDGAQEAVGDDILLHQHIEEEVDVVGSKTHTEHNGTHGNHPEGLSPLPTVFLWDMEAPDGVSCFPRAE